MKEERVELDHADPSPLNLQVLIAQMQGESVKTYKMLRSLRI